tara:strand:+ start:132 stop:341 length:210 start_codon:yes stop_codon:yes gene_type:complete
MKPSDFITPPDKIPPNWKTTNDWARRWKIGERQASRILRGAMRSRQVRRKLFRVRAGTAIRPVPHYAAA